MAAVDSLATTPMPAGGFPKIHLNDPEALTLGLSEAKASLIREADPNTVALVQIHGPEAAKPGNLGASAEVLREVIAAIFDEQLFIVVAPLDSRKISTGPKAYPACRKVNEEGEVRHGSIYFRKGPFRRYDVRSQLGVVSPTEEGKAALS